MARICTKSRTQNCATLLQAEHQCNDNNDTHPQCQPLTCAINGRHLALARRYMPGGLAFLASKASDKARVSFLHRTSCRVQPESWDSDNKAFKLNAGRVIK